MGQNKRKQVENKSNQGRYPNTFLLWDGSVWKCKRESSRFPTTFSFLWIWNPMVFQNFVTTFPNWVVFKSLESWKQNVLSEAFPIWKSKTQVELLIIKTCNIKVKSPSIETYDTLLESFIQGVTTFPLKVLNHS